jgi:hypothetical protein
VLYLRESIDDLLPRYGTPGTVVGAGERLAAEQAQRRFEQRLEAFGFARIRSRQESLELVEVDIDLRPVEPVLLALARDRVSEEPSCVADGLAEPWSHSARVLSGPERFEQLVPVHWSQVEREVRDQFECPRAQTAAAPLAVGDGRTTLSSREVATDASGSPIFGSHWVETWAESRSGRPQGDEEKARVCGPFFSSGGRI